ncbi:FxDxF family PEP-CTERM protein [Roseateles asaccharophilus]|uniref:Ice-binding protein C-terminal domain-containing protein n=1 Tax=Roseateles asaccharophilus TaxID=582607 RepID=A0ABU2ACJ1_9BURK|nr:FxDxF family PEP-CTERM protein [Roseateles asaccharophilus]MDR7334913.1 hypothetical protein [Roseateles asaccharophilus]
MKLKSLVAATLAVAAVSGAHAADADWGVHPAAPVLTGAWNPAGSFLDTFSFSLGSAATVTSSVLSFGNTVGGSYGLWSFGSDNTFGTADDESLGVWTLSTLPGPATNHVLDLDAGSYYYTVGGRALAGGSAYALSSSVAAVPEPETYALLAAGLGIVAFVARRRRDY